MSINSNNLNSLRENEKTDFLDGDLLKMYDSLFPDQQESFKCYVQEKLKKDPWAKPIIEEQICTNFRALELVDMGNRQRQMKRHLTMKAANDDNYSQTA